VLKGADWLDSQLNVKPLLFIFCPKLHYGVDDARGNAEALKKFRELGLKI
jgi:hypothetical protein